MLTYSLLSQQLSILNVTMMIELTVYGAAACHAQGLSRILSILLLIMAAFL